MRQALKSLIICIHVPYLQCCKCTVPMSVYQDLVLAMGKKRTRNEKKLNFNWVLRSIISYAVLAITMPVMSNFVILSIGFSSV